MPGIAFGTWTLGGGQTGIDFIEQAIEVGFHHIGEYGILIETQ
jgi:diketogulonate reductase-like aldo/keto reductase